jgi:exosortase A
MHSDPLLRATLTARATGRLTIGPAVVGASIVATLALFWPTFASMAELWRTSDAYRHGFLVVPLALWLVWREKDGLAAAPLAPCWWGLPALGALAAAWLLGVLASAQVVSQAALMAMCGAVVLTVVGAGWARVLWFPLLFLFFAVPAGEGLVPTLMDWTADVTVAALRLTGVPVYREGIHFVIPSGQWSVVEACSGVKFLVASLMIGTLYAWLVYRSTARRLLFVGASLVAPIVANWLRAYLTVAIAHLTDNRLLTGADHQPFGWLLFGAVELLLFWVGLRWREDAAESHAAARAERRARWREAGAAAVATALWLGCWAIAAQALLAPPHGQADTVRIAEPRGTGGWTAQAAKHAEWAPELNGAATVERFAFEREGRTVGVFVAVFRNQRQQGQLATSGNRIADLRSERWFVINSGVADTDSRGGAVPERVRSAVLRDLDANGGLAVWQWYWIDGTVTISDARGKLELARSRLLRRPDTGLWVALHAPLLADGSVDEQTLRRFVRDMGPSLAAAFESVAP